MRVAIYCWVGGGGVYPFRIMHKYGVPVGKKILNIELSLNPKPLNLSFKGVQAVRQRRVIGS